MRRVSAPAVEGFLVEVLRRLSCGPSIEAPALSVLVSRVELRNAETHLVVNAQALMPGEHPDLVLGAIQRRVTTGEQAIWESAAADKVRIVLPHRLQLRGGAKWLHGAAASGRKQVNPGLVQALRRAHADLLELKASPLTPSEVQKNATAPVTQHGRLMAHLAFLAPALQQQILDGSQPRAASLAALTNGKAPLAWADQAAWIEQMAGT